MRQEELYEATDSQLALDLTQYEYTKTLGAYKPKF